MSETTPNSNTVTVKDESLKLVKAPIVEAVVDIDCDMAAGFGLESLEQPAREAFRDKYPKFRSQFVQNTKFDTKQGAQPQVQVQHAIQAFQFLQNDEKQLVQTRVQGFSFNRLAPYTSLDDYLSEIERLWRIYVDLAAPVQIRTVRLRYINRILLPTVAGKTELNDYFRIGPRLPDEDKLTFVGFLNQHAAVEADTGHRVNIVLTTQGQEGDKLAIIFDNCVASSETGAPDDWSWILAKIRSLRALKNRIFRKTLTEKCLNLFQH